MKIIKEGEWKQSVTCRGCSSKLQFDVSDIEYEQEMQEDESFDWQFFINCPVCSRKIIQRNIPEKIRKEITNTARIV